jgi:hypothetical protein|tara:strand:+ start:1636 stop:1980 length:345 start_codon:yes stop_codon:yes gene_type:complete
MKNYNWIVTNLYTLDTATETEYVVNAVYDVIGTETSDNVEYTASLSGSAQFNVTEGSTFVPYSDLTNTLVIEWIQSGLGEDGVVNYEASVGGMIDSEITPPISPEDTPLPPNFG